MREQTEAVQRLVAQLIGRLINSDDPEHVHTALEASEHLPLLADELADLVARLRKEQKRQIELETLYASCSRITSSVMSRLLSWKQSWPAIASTSSSCISCSAVGTQS